jgi:putative peptidoglycan lipid II flippase
MVSRLLGLGREMLMAAMLGTGLASDAFFLAWMLPNLARRLFGEGAFAAALIPVFVDARQSGDEAGARRLVNAATTRLGLILVGLVLLGELLLGGARSAYGAQLAAWLGLSADLFARNDLALSLAQWLLPYLVLICLAGVLGGALNALDRFAVPAAAPVVLNVVWIGALLAGWQLYPDTIDRVYLLAVTLIGAGVLQLLMHTRAMKTADHPVRFQVTADPARVKRVRTLFGSLAIGLAMFQVNVLLDGLIAYSFVPTGGVSSLFYANRLVQLPIGVLGVALSTAVFPELARRAKAHDMTGLGAIVDRGLRIGTFVSLPAAVGLAVLVEPIVVTLFQRGAFDAESAARTSRALLFLSPAVIMACVSPVITRAFYAEEEVKTPVRVGVACVLLNLILNLALVGWLEEAGLALATSISQTVSLVVLAALFRWRRLNREDRPQSGATIRALARSLAAALLMGAAAWATHTYLPGPDWLRLGVAVAVGAGTYVALSWLAKAPELRLLLARR